MPAARSKPDAPAQQHFYLVLSVWIDAADESEARQNSDLLVDRLLTTHQNLGVVSASVHDIEPCDSPYDGDAEGR